jgi:nucleoside phosphorylase
VKKILIAAPLDYELEPIRRVLERKKFLLEIRTLVLGVGPKKSVKTLEKFLDEDSVWDQVLVIGLAGALGNDLKAGDIVAPSSVSDGHTVTVLSLSKDCQLAGAKQVPFLTMNRILKPSEKIEALQACPDAQAVDMESFGLAGLLQKRNLSFRIIRAILDENDYVFPDFRWIFSDTSKDRIPFCLYALTHPWGALRVLQFKRKLAASLESLTDFLGELL